MKTQQRLWISHTRDWILYIYFLLLFHKPCGISRNITTNLLYIKYTLKCYKSNIVYEKNCLWSQGPWRIYQNFKQTKWCVCMCTYTSLHMQVPACVSVYMCLCSCLHTHKSVCASVPLCVYKYAYVYVHAFMYVCMCAIQLFPLLWPFLSEKGRTHVCQFQSSNQMLCAHCCSSWRSAPSCTGLWVLGTSVWTSPKWRKDEWLSHQATTHAPTDLQTS